MLRKIPQQIPSIAATLVMLQLTTAAVTAQQPSARRPAEHQASIFDASGGTPAAHDASVERLEGIRIEPSDRDAPARKRVLYRPELPLKTFTYYMLDDGSFENGFALASDLTEVVAGYTLVAAGRLTAAEVCWTRTSGSNRDVSFDLTFYNAIGGTPANQIASIAAIADDVPVFPQHACFLYFVNVDTGAATDIFVGAAWNSAAPQDNIFISFDETTPLANPENWLTRASENGQWFASTDFEPPLAAGNPGIRVEGFEPGDCTPAADILCLNNGRFQVETDWRDFAGGTGRGTVTQVDLGDESGIFWFFDPNNQEFLVKVLDGCNNNGHFWVFAAATTNVEYTLTVTDTETGAQNAYTNPLGNAAPALTDTAAFATCP